MRFCMPQRGYHSRRIIVDAIKKYSDAALPELSGRGVGCLGMVSNCTKRNVFRLLSIIGFASLVAQGVRLVAGGDVDGWEIVTQLMATVVFCVMWRKYSLAVRRDYFYGSVLRRSRTWKDTD